MQAAGGELVDVSGGPDACWCLLRDLWVDGREFVIVEHDVLPAIGALEALEACDQDWCACPYQLARGVGTGLGCTRFSAALISAHPDLMDRVGEIGDPGDLPPRHWARLDVRIIQALREAGQPGVHVHDAHPATHLHVYG